MYLVALSRFFANITTCEYSRTVKTRTMSAARFATLTAEEKVILLESKDSTNTKDATNNELIK